MVEMIHIYIYLCFTRLYVVIICDGCIILDSILGVKKIIVLMFVSCRRDGRFVNLLVEDVWDNEDELTDALSEKVESWF